MSQVQQVYRRQLLSREQQEVSREHFQHYESALLSDIFRRNGRADVVRRATPPGYRYEREDVNPAPALDASGPVMQVAAHPGDGPDFFYATYLRMAAQTGRRQAYYEILLTDGERGVDGWTPERTRRVRIAEACAGAELVGSRLHFLGYPDGELSTLAERTRSQLVAELAELIGEIQPALLVVHPPKNDHPDHAYSFLLTLAALELNVRSGGRAPALFVHDVEFGLQQENVWTAQAMDSSLDLYPVHTPGFIVDISATHQAAQAALHKHQTQMYDPVLGEAKLYADLVDTLARVRGLQCMPEGATQIPRGQGFTHIVIPGLTKPHNILAHRLPAGSVYKRISCHAEREGYEARAEEYRSYQTSTGFPFRSGSGVRE